MKRTILVSILACLAGASGAAAAQGLSPREEAEQAGRLLHTPQGAHETSSRLFVQNKFYLFRGSNPDANKTYSPWVNMEMIGATPVSMCATDFVFGRYMGGQPVKSEKVGTKWRIDWTKVDTVEYTNEGIVISPAPGWALAAFTSDNIESNKRLTYALEVVRASCDPLARTGF